MKTIAIISEKGGTGKTTSAIGLAVTAARAGEAVAVIDLDPQANAANWKDRRAEENPAVVSAQVGRLTQTLNAARESGASLVILDTPGKNREHCNGSRPPRRPRFSHDAAPHVRHGNLALCARYFAHSGQPPGLCSIQQLAPGGEPAGRPIQRRNP